MSRDELTTIGEAHDRGIIRELPKEAQIEVCERILKTNPDWNTRRFAASLYLSLTGKEPA